MQLNIFDMLKDEYKYDNSKFGELLGIDWKIKINGLTKELVEKGNYD